MSTTIQTFTAAARAPSDCPPLPPSYLNTLVHIARWRARRQPDEVAFTFLIDGEEQEARLTYRQLDLRARSIAAELQARGLGGQRVLLVFHPGLDYNAAVFGCLYAGAVAVPVYPPDPFRAHRTLPRLRAIVEDAQASLVLGCEEILRWAGQTIESTCGAGTLTLESIAVDRWLDWEPFTPDANRLALLQYTSGSTGSPRGVMLSHGNLMHNLAALHRLDVDGAVAVCWVPPFHDMGLIGGIMLPVHSGRQVVLMSPLSFIQRPARWLTAMSRYRARTSPSPNFGFELCIRKIRPEECEGLDLSYWTAAINGAEPIRADTIDRFVEKFAPYGFRRETFYPAFGMAESTLLVSGGHRGDPVLTAALSAVDLEEDRVRELDPDDPDARRLVGCGRPIPGSEIVIADPKSCRRLPRGSVGEIWVRSPSVGQGYWNRPEETEQVFAARLAGEQGGTHLRTGDLGFVHRGELFVTGRIKELVILAGRNYYPHDIELIVQRSHAAMKPEGGAAFSVEVGDEEQLVVVSEVLRPKRYDLDQVLQAVRRELVEELELVPHAVVLIPVGTLPKTSSGKTRRRACQEMFLAGKFRALAEWRAASAGPGGGPPGQPADPPRTPVEQTLARLFTEVLGIEPIRRSDDFFALGGQSLRAVQLAGRISDDFAIEVSLPLLFERPTLAAMAEWIEARSSDRAKQIAGPPKPPILRRSPEAPTVLSSAEQRLWFFDQLEPNHPFYNMPVAARLSGPLDDAALERSLQELVSRHDTLRTTYPAENGRPTRRIAPEAQWPLCRVDLRRLPPEAREAELRRLLTQEAREPFNLAAGPLLRSTLYRLAEQEHVLLLAMHHVIVDGWSMGVMAGELAALYEAFRGGQPSPLVPPELEYADFAAWQHDRLASGALEGEVAYWKERLCDEPPVLDLPTDRPRPPRQTFRGALYPVEFPADLSERVRRLAVQERTTLFAVLLAGYNVLLGRCCRQDDVAVGTVTANRTRKELEGLVGFFANTLVLRTDLSGNPTFRQLVGRASKVALHAYDNQELPFDKLVELLDPQRHRNQAPLFQAALVLENMPLELPDRSGLKVQPILNVDNGTAKYDVAVLLSEEGGKLTGQVEYSTDLFDAETIGRMMNALRTLLAAAVDDPDRPISRLPLLDRAERRRLLADFNATEAEPAPPVCLHHLVEQRVRKTPDRVAVRCAGRELTYGELDRQANRLARGLSARGVVPDQPVAVCLPRSAELVIAMLGVLKAGGAYVPVDPALPTDRMSFLLKDTGAPLVLTRRTLAGQLPLTGAEMVLLEEIAGESDGDDDAPPHTDVRPDHLAYILYTSGSTGRPKGVLTEHRGVVSFTKAFSRALRIGADCRVLHFFSPSSDGSISDVFSALANGACLVVAGPEVLLQTDGLQNVVRHERVTTATLTPSMLPLLEPDELPDLHTVCSVGEAAAGDFVRQWSRPGRRLVNGYGVTEAACGVCLMELTVPTQGRPPIGRPLDHVQIYILDEHLEPVPLGVPGEICVGGVQVARGYLNRPEQTARSFVPDPFRNEPGARLYRTGDLGVRRPDGVIEFLGRLDNQVNLRGHRVEPDEIAKVLQQHAGVDQAAVIAREEQPGQMRLVAYVVPAAANVRRGSPDPAAAPTAGLRACEEMGTGTSRQPAFAAFGPTGSEPVPISSQALSSAGRPAVTPVARSGDRPQRVSPGGATTASGPATADLRQHLLRQLPHYMVPSAFVTLDALPRTVQGKLDRRALPAPPADRRDRSEDYVAPRDDHERLVASVWEQLLDVRPIGARDNFFELGGHSMLAVQVMAEIERQSGRRVPLAALFQDATVEHLARVLRQPEVASPEMSLVPLATTGSARPLFCIHPAGGTVFCYRALAEELGGARPVFGLQAVGVDGLRAPHHRAEDMAAHYLQAIRTVQAHGPYLLAGWSLGGNLAYEMARQLAEQDEPIGLLALLDAAALPADRQPDESDFLPMLMEFFPEEENLPLDEIQAMSMEEQLAYFVKRAGQAQIVGAADVAAAHHVFEVFKTSMKAILDYRQKPYPGKVTLFAAEHREAWFGGDGDPQLGWARWARGGVEVHAIPGGHIQMVHPPNVHVLADKLRACLARADAQT